MVGNAISSMSAAALPRGRPEINSDGLAPRPLVGQTLIGQGATLSAQGLLYLLDSLHELLYRVRYFVEFLVWVVRAARRLGVPLGFDSSAH
jgi:hypothetical protein